jgi:cholesterol transport system auxiliary component
MEKIKSLIIMMTITLFTFSGCGSSGSYYVLSVASQPTTIYKSRHKIIGVEKITIPGYLYKREIAVAKSSSQITLLSGAIWGEDLDDGLTNRLISFLQKKFKEPSVYAYPWNVERVPTIKIKVQITRFIAQGNRVYLDADWEVEHIGTGKRRARLFSTSVATGSDASSIVSSMDQAFKELEESIATGIK